MRMWIKRAWDGGMGTYHRLDGPAVEWDDGSKEWHAEQEAFTIQELAGHVQRLEREVFYLTKKVEELSR